MRKALAAAGVMLALVLASGWFFTQRATILPKLFTHGQAHAKLNVLLLSFCSLSAPVLGLRGDFYGGTPFHAFAKTANVFDNYYSSHPWLNIGRFTAPIITRNFLRAHHYGFFAPESGGGVMFRVPGRIWNEPVYGNAATEEDEHVLDLQRMGRVRELLFTLPRPFFLEIHVKYMHFPFYDSVDPVFAQDLKLPAPLAHRLQELKARTELAPAEMIPEALLFARVDHHVALGMFNLLMNRALTDRWRNSPTYGLDLELLREVYRAKFAHFARAVGPVLNLFDDKSLQKNTVVILDGDHGEGFMEHGAMGHAVELYNEFIRVPLMIKFPGDAPHAKIETLFDKAAASELVAHILDGQVDADRLPAWVSSHAPKNILSRSCDGTSFSVTTGDHWKYIHRFADDTRELYDTANDPGEKSNVVATHAAKAQEFDEYILLNSRTLDEKYEVGNLKYVESCAHE